MTLFLLRDAFGQLLKALAENMLVFYRHPFGCKKLVCLVFEICLFKLHRQAAIW